MTLAIDIGNSRTKAALFEHSVLMESRSFDNRELGELKTLVGKYTPAKAILATVVEPDPALLAYLEQHTTLYHFPGGLRLPVENRYRTPATLGADRLAAVIGAGAYGTSQDSLVIVAGTCITYNFLSSRNQFLGGAITPGLNMRLQAMHTFTGKLPLITLDEDFNGLLGRDTRESILSGVQAGTLGEMEHMIGRYLQNYPRLRVFLCGGDAEFFDKRLKNSIFADRTILDRELILKGLDRVLNYHYS